MKLYFPIIAVIIFVLGFASAFMLYPSQSIQTKTSLSIGKNEMADILSAQANIVAVTNSGQGVFSKANVQIQDGQGRVLINTEPFIEPTTQSSLEVAKTVAENETGINLDNKDVIFFISDINAQLVGGPSAGGAFTAATIAAIEGKKIRSDVTVTGTIETDGSIGPVGGLNAKLDAAIENNNTIFLIPKGQNNFTYIEQQKVVRRWRNFNYVVSQPVAKEINLQEYGAQKGIKVIEVTNIDDVLKYLLVN